MLSVSLCQVPITCIIPAINPVVSFFSHYTLLLFYVLLCTLCTSLHLCTLLFCIYYYYCCCCTVCTALLFSYSAIFIATSVRNKLIHSFIHSSVQCILLLSSGHLKLSANQRLLLTATFESRLKAFLLCLAYNSS